MTDKLIVHLAISLLRHLIVLFGAALAAGGAILWLWQV